MASLDSLDVTVGFDRTYLLVVSARVSALALHSAYYGWEGKLLIVVVTMETGVLALAKTY